MNQYQIKNKNRWMDTWYGGIIIECIITDECSRSIFSYRCRLVWEVLSYLCHVYILLTLNKDIVAIVILKCRINTAEIIFQEENFAWVKMGQGKDESLLSWVYEKLKEKLGKFWFSGALHVYAYLHFLFKFRNDQFPRIAATLIA